MTVKFKLCTRSPRLELRVNQLGSITVTDGQGKRIMCHDAIAFIFDPTKPENSQSGIVTVTEKMQVFKVRARTPGRAHIWMRGPTFPGPTTLGGIISVVPDILIEVKTFFHFLDGPTGIKTTRTPGDLDGILKTMNDIYRGQASITFVNAGVNPSLNIKGLGGGLAAVRTHPDQGNTDDTRAITARKSDVLFNVFLVGRFFDLPTMNSNPSYLALTSKPPNDAKPLRCCLCRDPQRGDPPGVDVGEILAHEAGHALGEDDDINNPFSLMYWTVVGQLEDEIDHPMAQRMWKSIASFPP